MRNLLKVTLLFGLGKKSAINSSDVSIVSLFEEAPSFYYLLLPLTKEIDMISHAREIYLMSYYMF